MLKKTFFVGIISIVISSLFLAPLQIFAKEFYLQYVGSQFIPEEETFTYDKYTGNYGLRHETPAGAYYYVGVNIPQPHAGSYFLKSVHIRYYDGNNTGYIEVKLRRRNIWTDAQHTVATWQSSYAGTPGWARANVSTIDGYKKVDTAKFVYFLEVYFSDDDTPGPLVLYQVRIHYGGL